MYIWHSSLIVHCLFIVHEYIILCTPTHLPTFIPVISLTFPKPLNGNIILSYADPPPSSISHVLLIAFFVFFLFIDFPSLYSIAQSAMDMHYIVILEHHSVFLQPLTRIHHICPFHSIHVIHILLSDLTLAFMQYHKW